MWGYFISKGIIVCIINGKRENVTKISIVSLYVLVLEDSFQKKPQPSPNSSFSVIFLIEKLCSF